MGNKDVSYQLLDYVLLSTSALESNALFLLHKTCAVGKSILLLPGQVRCYTHTSGLICNVQCAVGHVNI